MRCGSCYWEIFLFQEKKNLTYKIADVKGLHDLMDKSGPRTPFQHKDLLSRFRDYHFKDKTVVRLSYLYNGNSYACEIASLCWNCQKTLAVWEMFFLILKHVSGFWSRLEWVLQIMSSNHSCLSTLVRELLVKPSIQTLGPVNVASVGRYSATTWIWIWFITGSLWYVDRVGTCLLS